MRPIAILGIVLVVVGIGSLVYNVIPIHHTEEVAKIGPITATKDEERDIVVPPIAGVLAVLAGGVMIFAGRRA
jgi:hypothetical protein